MVSCTKLDEFLERLHLGLLRSYLVLKSLKERTKELVRTCFPTEEVTWIKMLMGSLPKLEKFSFVSESRLEIATIAMYLSSIRSY